MDSIISTFHIDWKLIIAQLVNFGIVVGVLYYFVLKPLTKIMADRTATIENSLADAKAVSEKLQQTEQEKHEIIKQSRQEAEKIIKESQVIANTERDKTIAAAKKQVEQIVADSKQEIARQKQQMINDVQTHVAELVVAASAQVLAGVSDKKIDSALANKAVAELKKVKS